MYICPICNRNFEEENKIAKHLLLCWKTKHPYHQSVPAPHSEDVVTVDANENVLKFFNSFIGAKND